MSRKILTLLIIHQNDKVLLGMKKRGFGMGKWNGFGGKASNGETIEEAVKRELFEESALTVDAIKKMGTIDFSWQGKEEHVLEVHIFKATEFFGEPQETEEMSSKWFLVKDIPYEKMWPDDKYWMPLFLENKKFRGKFNFDSNNNILNYKLN